jgi:hypothetical protein
MATAKGEEIYTHIIPYRDLGFKKTSYLIETF